MKEMKFLWTTINVKNMDESIAFYSNLAGLQVLQRFPAGPGREIAFLGNDTDDETLVELMTDSGHSEVNFGESISIGFAVDSVDTMLETVKANNITVHSGPFETPGFKFYCIKDPNGLNVQFFEKK
jgi:lactoylglutathione lyase